MEEKIIVKAEQYNVKFFLRFMLIMGAIFSILFAVVFVVDSYYDGRGLYVEALVHQEDGRCGSYYEDGELCYSCKFIAERQYSSANEYAMATLVHNFFENYFLITLIPLALFALIGGFVYLWLRSYEMTVTDKRVFGKVAWGKRVDLPLDSISSTATISLFKGIAVATSSGRIKCLMVKNSAEIFEKVNALLVKRQKEQKVAAPTTVITQTDEADKLKKFKELLDSGIITQEEFDAKKKELLGL